MKIKIFKEPVERIKTPLLIVPLFSDEIKIPVQLHFLKKYIQPGMETIFTQSNFKGKSSENLAIYLNHISIPMLVFLGLGKRDEWSLENARVAFGNAVKIVQSKKIKKFSIYWDSNYPFAASQEIFILEIVTAMMTATFKMIDFLTDSQDIPPSLESVNLLFSSGTKVSQSFIRKGEVLGGSVNLSRQLCEYPANLMTPAFFVEKIKKLAREMSWKLEILDRQILKKKGLNALLAVSQGSENPPFLVIATYQHSAAKKTLGLVGKGITFDTGGISIKAARRMEEMKYDMAGAAAVLGALQAISITKLPVNVVAGFPLAENMPSGKATRPGDIVKSYCGKTIEIVDTDAEGRLILADALSYIEKHYQPDYMVDLATLTGAVVAALGHHAAAILTSDESLLKSIQSASDLSGDRIWPLPLWDDYKDLIKSKVADIRNIGTKPVAGVITGAIFLKGMINKTPWAHLDIAGTAYDMPEKSYLESGATGFGVKLLWHWANILSKE
jgi:leucyl aminopeptidase